MFIKRCFKSVTQAEAEKSLRRTNLNKMMKLRVVVLAM